ncbi:unnamed protein product [Schistosoma mattheei]|uniref:Uncharacterized protein n=1 Tax=Schistosoma mattheei TaxID=31246 RepID=A0A183NJP2_9TREM|nr:unnamed protein product [Schistosoma mattheei]
MNNETNSYHFFIVYRLTSDQICTSCSHVSFLYSHSLTSIEMSKKNKKTNQLTNNNNR